MEENREKGKDELERFGFDHTETLGLRRSVVQLLSEVRMRAAILGKRLQLAFRRIDRDEYNEYVASVNKIAETSYRKRAEDYHRDKAKPKAPLFAHTVNYNASQEDHDRSAEQDRDGRPGNASELENGTGPAASEKEPEQGSPQMDFATHRMSELIERKLDTEVNEDRLYEISQGLSNRLGRTVGAELATLTRENGKEIDVIKISCSGFEDVYLDRRLNQVDENGKFIRPSYTLGQDLDQALAACAPRLVSEVVDKECAPFLRSPMQERARAGEAFCRRAMELEDGKKTYDHQMGITISAKREGEWLTFTGYDGKQIERVRVDELHRFKDSRKALASRINESIRQAEIAQETQMRSFEDRQKFVEEPVRMPEKAPEPVLNGETVKLRPEEELKKALSRDGHPAYVQMDEDQKTITVMIDEVSYEFDRTGRLVGGSAFGDPEHDAESVILRARIVDAAKKLEIESLDKYVIEKKGIYPDKNTINTVLHADPGDSVLLSYRSPLTVELARSEKEPDRIDGKIYLREDGECREFHIDISSDSEEKNIEEVQAVLAKESVDLNRELVERYNRSLEEDRSHEEKEALEDITKAEEHALDTAEKVFVLDAGYPEIPDDVQSYIHECLMEGSLSNKDVAQVKDSVEAAVEKFPDLDERQRLAVMFYANDDLEKDYAAMFEKDVKEKTDEEREEREEREEDEPELGINERSIFA